MFLKDVTGSHIYSLIHSRPQRPRSFWSAPRIATSGQVQQHSGIEWLCKHKRLRPEPIRFVRLKLDSRAHVPFGQHQDTELWNNQFPETKHFRPQSLRSFWPSVGIESSGLVQHRKSAIHGLPSNLANLIG